MKHHIVSIGISRHQNATANLHYAAKDATEFYELLSLNLRDQGYKKLLVDSEATLAQIQSALGSELREAVSKEDALFFFYSGHGAVGPAKNDSNTAVNYLVPFDATYDFENSCISIDYLKQVFENLTSKANFIFVDSCFSGSLTKHTKGYPVPKAKPFKVKTLRSFANTEIGNGTLIFTACKDDQESIEDPEYKNGLFTFELLTELQMHRDGERYDALSIFSPVAGRVEERARARWQHPQIPTFSGKLQGKVSLPVFKNRLKVTPELISVPRYSALAEASFPAAQIELSDKDKEKALNEAVQFVIQTRKDSDLGEINYERYCGRLLREIKRRWEQLFIEIGSDVQELPNTVAKLEAASFQFMLLGAVSAKFGSKAQMVIYSKYTVSILEWTQNKSGLVAVISTPEILVADITYLIGVISLASQTLEPLGMLMNTNIDDPRERDVPPYELIKYTHIFYCDALGGYSNKVHDHIRELLKSFEWLPELVPSLEGKVEHFQHQVNLLLSVWAVVKGGRLWPDFARFYAHRVMPFVKKIKYDDEFRKKIGALIGVKEPDVRKVFRQSVSEYSKRGLGGGYWWDSIAGDDFLTQEEKEKLRADQHDS